MDLLLWIGPRHGPAELKSLLAAQSIELMAFETSEEALRATVGQSVAVAIVTVDWKEAPQAIETLLEARPEVQVLLATDIGIPRTVVLSLWAGASSVLDFRSQTRSEIVLRVQESLQRHRQAARERSLLLRLRSLNEDFLKNIVGLEKRNIELEQKLQPATEQLAGDEEGPARVLVVDDEEVVRQVVEMVLAKKGHQFVSVADGEAGLAAIKEGRFHLVITDKNLPGMSGLDLLREVKKISPETDLILMTGYSSMDSAIDALNIGAAAYLEKPFDHVKTVMEKIEGVLAQQRERNKKRHYLQMIKERNRDFLEQYKTIRADLENWLQSRAGPPPP